MTILAKKELLAKNKRAGLACLCALAALGPSCPVRAEKPLERSRGAVESLLGNVGPAFSPNPGAPLPFPDVPAPLPPGNLLQTTTPEKLRGIAAEAVLEQVQEIDGRSSLRGQDYFSGHPDAPKIKAAFRDAAGSCRAPEPCVVQVGERALMYENRADLNRWYPRIGPIRGYRTTYSPANGETYPPLIEVELQLDKSLYERLFQEAQQLFGPAFFKDEKAAAERLAFLLAPRAAADLELSRLLDEQKIPDGLWVDEIEELRLSWEVAALRAQIAMHEAMLSGPGFKFLPAELDYLARRFGDGSLEAVLAPRAYLFTDPAAQDWEALGKQSKMIPLLELGGKEPDEQVQDKNRQNTWNLIGELQRQLQAGATQRNIWLQFQLQKAERAEAYLAKPDAVAGLRRALKLERERAQSFPFLSVSAGSRWIFQTYVDGATHAAEDLDIARMTSQLRAAETAARKGGLSFDGAATAEALLKKQGVVLAWRAGMQRSGGTAVNGQGGWLAVADGGVYRNGEKIVPGEGSGTGEIAVNAKGDWIAAVNNNVYRNGKKLAETEGRATGGVAINDKGDWLAVVDGDVIRDGTIAVHKRGYALGGAAINNKGDWIAVVGGDVYRNGEEVVYTQGHESGGAAINGNGNWVAVAYGDIYYNGHLAVHTGGTASGGAAINDKGDWVAVAADGIYRNGEQVVRAEGAASGGAAINDNGDWIAVADGNLYYNGKRVTADGRQSDAVPVAMNQRNRLIGIVNGNVYFFGAADK